MTKGRATQNLVNSKRSVTKGSIGRLLLSLAAAMFLVLSMGGATWALPILPLQVSTNPGNGDLNPYGVVYVPLGFPDNTVQPGNILVANFNDKANNQGQGTTIINIRQDRTTALFAKGLTPGLTAAMGILRAGFVLIGSITVPIPSNFPGAIGGPITVLDSNGNVVTTITSSLFLNGPWGMAVDDDITSAKVWVSNVLAGTVIRINLTINLNMTPPVHVDSITKVASGYNHVNTATMPLLGPSGLAYSEQNHILYVSTSFGFVFAVPNADTRTTPISLGTQVYRDGVHLHGPLGLALAPNGDLISAQSDGFNVNPALPSEIVEFTPDAATNPPGHFVAQYSIDAANGGAFNIALNQSTDPLVPLGFAYVDDNENSLVQLYLPTWQFGFGNVLLNHR